MLREGWDVQSVTVIVGLRPYTAKANILPEQTVGRGLRLMFRGTGLRLRRARGRDRQQEVHRVCRAVGTRRRHAVWTRSNVGKDKVVIVTIAPDPDKKDKDIACRSSVRF